MLLLSIPTDKSLRFCCTFIYKLRIHAYVKLAALRYVYKLLEDSII